MKKNMNGNNNYIFQVLMLAKKYWGWLLLRAIASVGLIIFDIFIPAITSIMLDQASESSYFATVYIPIIVALILGHILMMSLGVATWGYLESHFIVDLRKKTLNVILHMKAEEKNRYTVSELLQILNEDLSQFMQVLVRNISNAIVYTIYCVAILIMLFCINVYIAGICLFVAIGNVFVGKYFAQKGRLEKRKYREELGNYKAWVEDRVSGMYEIENLHIKPAMHREFLSLMDKYVRQYKKTDMADKLYPITNEWIAEIAKILIYVLGAYLAVSANLSTGQIVACLSYFSLLYVHLNKLLNIRFDYSVRKIHIQKVFNLWKCEQEIEDVGDSLEEIQNICLKHVSFEYTPGSPVFCGVDLKVEKGEIVNIIGENGKGKSTLAYLLFGFYRHQTGQILLNNKDISSYQLRDIRRNIGIVTQKSGYLQGRFRDVIMTGCCLEKGDDKLVEILKSLKLYERIIRLPEGLDTYIADFDKVFSRGEIQRLQLTNILLRECSVIILDEATSHVDREMEERIYSVLTKIQKDKIVINITHNRLMNGDHVQTYRLNAKKLERVLNAE